MQNGFDSQAGRARVLLTLWQALLDLNSIDLLAVCKDKRDPGPHSVKGRARGVHSPRWSGEPKLVSVLPCAHKIGAHSPHAATRGWSPVAALAATAIRSLATLTNRTGSGTSFTMNLDSVSATSRGMYLPRAMAVATSTPDACNPPRMLFRCDSVATTITAFPIPERS